MTLTELGPLAWALLAAAAMAVGFAKTTVGGAGALAVVAFAAVLPARESTGALLPCSVLATWWQCASTTATRTGGFSHACSQESFPDWYLARGS